MASTARGTRSGAQSPAPGARTIALNTSRSLPDFKLEWYIE